MVGGIRQIAWVGRGLLHHALEGWHVGKWDSANIDALRAGAEDKLERSSALPDRKVQLHFI